VGFDDLRIRDISRFSGEWSPPIGALGGPPAHELYRDLVLYAGLQLFQDARSRPWVVFRDGAQRRSFSVPSIELRNALDRFRMHRSARPLPRGDLDEFVRIVEARVSDPDVKIPLLRSPLVDGAPATDGDRRLFEPSSTDRAAQAHTPTPTASSPTGSESEPSPPSTAVIVPARTSAAGREFLPPTWVNVPRPGLEASISGGALLPPRRSADATRYVRALRRLLRDGDWMGTTRELAEVTRDDPLTLYASLLRYRAELADNDILLANVEVGEGFRWLVVDRSRVRNLALSGDRSDLTSALIPRDGDGRPADVPLAGSAQGRPSRRAPPRNLRPTAPIVAPPA